MTSEELDAVINLLAQQAGLDPVHATVMVTDALREAAAPMKPLAFYDSLHDANAARQREWKNSDKLDLSFLGNALAGEVGEACNVIKKLERERLGLDGSRAWVADLAAELADVVIYTSLIAIKTNIGLERAVIDKFNETSEKLGFKTRLR